MEKRIQELAHIENKYKKAEEALTESEGRYRAAVEDMPGRICSFLPGGDITFVNKAYCEYFGSTFDELVGTNFLSLIPESEQNAVMANISGLKVESPTQSHEHRVIAPNGNIRWQSWTNRALFDDQGKIIGYQSIGVDITERKQTEEALRQEKNRAQKLLDIAGVIFVAIDASGEVTLVNQKGSLVLGYEQQQIIGKNWFNSFIPESIKDETKTVFNRLMIGALGYKTKTVSSGEEAVEYLKENNSDLILLDMIMDPGINGRETYERIKEIHPNQKAIIISGFAETDEVKEAQKLGVGKYIKKPFTLEMIGIAVKEELKK